MAHLGGTICSIVLAISSSKRCCLQAMQFKGAGYGDEQQMQKSSLKHSKCSWIWLGWIFEIIVVILHIMAINKNYQWDRKDYNNVSSQLSVSVSCSQHLERKGGHCYGSAEGGFENDKVASLGFSDTGIHMALLVKSLKGKS